MALKTEGSNKASIKWCLYFSFTHSLTADKSIVTSTLNNKLSIVLPVVSGKIKDIQSIYMSEKANYINSATKICLFSHFHEGDKINI